MSPEYSFTINIKSELPNDAAARDFIDTFKKVRGVTDVQFARDALPEELEQTKDMSFGEFLRFSRQQQGMSQLDLSIASGLSMISPLETGKYPHEPSSLTARKILRGLGWEKDDPRRAQFMKKLRSRVIQK